MKHHLAVNPPNGGAIHLPPIDKAGLLLPPERPAEPTKQEIFEMQIARFYDYIDHITNRHALELTSEQRRQLLQEKYSVDKFRDAMYDIFGDEIKVEDVRVLYRRISANPDVEVDWSEVFGYGDKDTETAQWRAQEAKEKQGDNVIDDDKVIVTKLRRQVADAAGSGSKRRDIVKQIIYVPQADNYVVASQHGLVQVLGAAKYNTVTSLTVQQGDMITSSCCFLPNLRRLAIATDRQLCIWDYRSPSRESFVISPFPANLLCVTAIVSDAVDTSPFEDSILFGDVEGCVGIIRIHQKDLSVKAPHKKQTNHGNDDRGNENGAGGHGKKDGLVHVIDIATLSSPIIRKKVHNDWTVKVVHCPDLKMFGSCSPSTKTSFIAEDLNSLKSDKPYPRYVSVEKGCNTFAYSDRSNIFVTGGSDKILRIWHPGIYTKPAGKLHGHIFSIVDIAINDADQHIISLSSARLIRVWDIHTLTALQVFGDNENRPGERRIHCLLYDFKNEVLLTGSSVVDEWPLARKYHATILVPQTHPYAVLMMAVNEQLGQLLSSDTTPQIRVWEIESGKLLSQVNHPHGENVEVVAAAFDPNGFRLATGGMNGSIRVWDFGSTQILKGYDAVQAGDDKTIIDLHYYARPAIPGVNYLIGLGWGGKIKVFRDSNQELDLIELCDFSQPDFQEPDMLFTPLMDDPEQARRTVETVKEEEERLHLAGHSKPVGLKPGEQPRPHPKKHPLGSDGNEKLGMAQRHVAQLQSNASFLREKSSVDELLRYGFNRGLFLAEDRRTLITGTSLGHLVQWDLRSMSMEIRWRLPPLAPGESTSSENMALVGREKSTARDDFIPTPLSNTSMIDLAKFEMHRVNGILVVRPSVPEKKKKINDDGLEVTDSDDDDENDDDDEDDGNAEAANASRPDTANSGEAASTGKKTPESRRLSLALNEAEAAGANKADREAESPMPTTGNGASKPASSVSSRSNTPHVLYRTMTLLVSAHQDSWIRFWTMNSHSTGPNRLVHKTQMEVNSHPSAVTCLTTDGSSKFLAAGDYKGFVCTWTMQLQIPSVFKQKIVKHGLTNGRRHSNAAVVPKITQVLGAAAPTLQIKFRVSWRAHNVKIEDIHYYQQLDLLFTASTDSSVRIWRGFSSKYLGFFGQPQPFVFTGRFYGPLTQPVLPDIDDKPVYPVTSEKVLERKRAARKIRDLPLIVDRSRWNRASSASSKDPSKKRFWQPKMVKDQYFNLLIKPKLHSQGIPASQTTTATTTAATSLPANLATVKKPLDTTGIYRALLTYGVSSMDHVNPRAIDFGILDPKDKHGK